MSYSFHNRLMLSGGLETRGLGEPNAETGFVDLPSIVLANDGPDGAVELSGPAEGETIRDAIELRLEGRDFPTFDAALVAGHTWRNHLIIGFAHTLIGIKIGSADNPTTPLRRGFGVPYYESPPRRVREEPGLVVFRTAEGPPRSGPQLLAYARPLQGLDGLVNYTLRWITHRRYDLGPQQSMAYTLVHASFFEDNPETAFILLVTAIEGLLPPREDNPREIAAVIDALKVKLDEMSDIDDDLRQAVAAALEDDKFDPIGRRGRQLVSSLGTERFAGQKPRDYFNDCYEVRSKLVHPGPQRTSEANLRERLLELRRFVLALLGVQVFGERMPDYWTPETVPWS